MLWVLSVFRFYCRPLYQVFHYFPKYCFLFFFSFFPSTYFDSALVKSYSHTLVSVYSVHSTRIPIIRESELMLPLGKTHSVHIVISARRTKACNVEHTTDMFVEAKK